MSILTNPRVAWSMDELELLARQGDPWAQAELERQCHQFAQMVQADERLGADLQERNKLLKR